VITVRRVSGTVKKAEEEILRRDKAVLRDVRLGKGISL
jgi:RNase P/RNase MRP subunit POP5